MPKKDDLTGRRFGRLTVEAEVPERKNGKICWLCVCACGNKVTVRGNDLTSGKMQSCGCLRSENTVKMNSETKVKHGGKGTRLYNIWVHMRQRCRDANAHDYKNYGGRGIEVCTEWRDNFEAFRDWAQTNGYQDTLTIDRIDANGNYCPENCRWATPKEQANNRRTTRKITCNKETHSISEWAGITGINKGTLKDRINRGWTTESALDR